MVEAYCEGVDCLETRSGTVGLLPAWERIMMSNSFKSMIVVRTFALADVPVEPVAIEPGPSERLPEALRWLPPK